MHRRRFLRRAGAASTALLAGCSAEQVDPGGGTTTRTATTGTPTLRVGAYPSFVDAPSSSPGGWVKERFESEFDADLKWFAPERELNYFLQRRQQGVTVDTDLYVGLTPVDLVRADAALSGDAALFESVDVSGFENASHLKDHYRFDPKHRAVPFGGSYISLVYDGTEVDAPETFEALTRPEYEDALVVSNPQSSETGLEFMFWTVARFGEDGYLDYWNRLQANGVRVLGSWSDAYAAYSNGEAPVVVSFSTDRVYADRYDEPMEKHRIGFLDGQGYTYREGMARFADTDRPDLASAFMEFLLRPEVQAGVAKRNVVLPAVDNADLPADFDDLVAEPAEPVGYGYDDLQGNVQPWLDRWSKQVASN